MNNKRRVFNLVPILMSTMLAALFVFSGILGELPIVGSELGVGEVYADTIDVTIDGLKYTVDKTSKTATVKKYDSIPAGGALTIPSTINHDGTNYTVTSIGEYAFSRCTDLTSVTIPGAIEEIKKCAFEYCQNLKNVVIMDGVKNIGWFVFQDCGSLEYVRIPSIDTDIGFQAFDNCNALKNIEIPYDFNKRLFSNKNSMIYPKNGDAYLIGQNNPATGTFTYHYPLYLGDTQVKSTNLDNILKTESNGEATASYDPASKTLTLRNPDITGAHNDYKIWTTDSLTIQGRATIKGTKGIAVNYEPTGEVTSQDNLKTLTIKNNPEIDTDIEIHAYNEAIFAKNTNVIMNGGMVCAYSDNWRCVNIQYHGSFTINDGYMRIETASTRDISALRTWNPSPSDKYGTPLTNGSRTTINGGTLKLKAVGGSPINASGGITYPKNFFAYDLEGNPLKLRSDGKGFTGRDTGSEWLQDATIIITPQNINSSVQIKDLLNPYSTKESINVYWKVRDAAGRDITGKLSDDDCVIIINGVEYPAEIDCEIFSSRFNHEPKITTPGTYDFKIAFKGRADLDYLPSEYSGKLDVIVKKDLVLEYNVQSTVKVGESLPISGTIVDEDGKPMSNVRVGLWVTGSGFNEVDYAITDENGVWNYEGTRLTPPKAGEYSLSNIWVGNIDFSKYNEYWFYGNDSITALNELSVPSFEGVEVNHPAVKKKYNCGERFNPNGLVVKAKYNEGRVQTLVTLEEGDYQIIPSGELKGNTKHVAITYSDYGRTKTAVIPVEISHAWDKGRVTKAATVTSVGQKKYNCSKCDAVRTESIPKLQDPTTQVGEGGSAIGKGASFEAANKAITASSSEEGPKGSKFAPLQLTSKKPGKTNIKLSWKKPAGATKFVIYGNACGKKNKLKKIATVKGTSYNAKKVAGKAVKKGTYYKFMVVALDKNNKVISTSKVLHVATAGGKVKNYTGITVTSKDVKYAKNMKVGKTLNLGAKLKGSNVKKHRGLCYETSNAKVATVSSKGVIKAKGKGSCKIYIYTQNGLVKIIKVTVK